MGQRKAGHTSVGRLLSLYAAISLVPVVLLGLVLALNYQAEARQRGLAEGRSEAISVAKTAVEPALTGARLSKGLHGEQLATMRALARRAVGDGDVLRLRLRDLQGTVVFSDDGTGFGSKPEDQALAAARGAVVARLTHLNADSDDSGPIGPSAVEVYVPLTAGSDEHRVGVLEIYLPYAPISADVGAGLHHLYLDLGVGLALLYVALFLISFSVSRRLRHQLQVNTHLAETDPLTDLPNRTAFHRRVEAACEAAQRTGGSVAIAIVDLDRFKEVNDTLGHHNGDVLLCQVTARLLDALGDVGSAARLGGDEFAVLVPRVPDAAAAQAVAERVLEALLQPFVIDELSLGV
ncbi:MAG: diguanylate cyclase domain-containing protein, partial [Acidimicrobiales bacterium]